MDTLAKYLEGKGAGSAGSLRQDMNTQGHEFTFSEKQIIEELKNIKNRFENVKKRSNNKKVEKSFAFDSTADSEVFKGQMDQRLKAFASTLVSKLKARYKSLVSNNYVKWVFVQNTTGFTIKGEVEWKPGTPQPTDVYTVIRDNLADAQREMREDFADIFYRADKSMTSPEALFNVGHDTAVVERKLGAINTFLQTLEGEVGAFQPELQTVFKKWLAELEIDAEVITTVDARGGVLKTDLKITTNIESWFNNQLVRNKRETALGKAIQAVDKKTLKQKGDTLIKRLIDRIEKFYESKSDYTDEEIASDSLRKQIGKSFVLSPTMRRLQKKGLVKNLSQYTGKAPKSKKTPKAKGTIKTQHKTSRSTPKKIISNMGAAPTVKRSTAESPRSTGNLVALLNAKLPQTVARNMGPPGLENQTGRFASSVRVTDVSQTAQGHPSVGYSYQKNPYQVFEMSHGDPRWATPDRDPRKLIDASIREIASQLAMGRFYTRRI